MRQMEALSLPAASKLCMEVMLYPITNPYTKKKKREKAVRIMCTQETDTVAYIASLHLYKKLVTASYTEGIHTY